MASDDLKTIIEALLFATDEPIPLKRITGILDFADGRAVHRALDEMKQQYDDEGRAFALEEIAGGYQLLTRKDYAPWVAKLSRASAKSKLSQAALETLAIIAYKQPILRADIEGIRGVQVDAIVRALTEKELIKIVGRHESLGRPLLYGTTRKFLEAFGLRSLDDLPKLQSAPAAPPIEQDAEEAADPAGTHGPFNPQALPTQVEEPSNAPEPLTEDAAAPATEAEPAVEIDLAPDDPAEPEPTLEIDLAPDDTKPDSN